VGLVTAETFSERVARIKAAKPTSPQPPIYDPDLIPELESSYERTQADDEIDAVVDGVDIIDAYIRWCGKMVPNPGGKRESIMISCPKPDHADRTPSAWINLDKQTWFCGPCDEGGDKLDIAAYHFGFPVPGYKTGKNFPELRKRIAEDLGYVVKRSPAGTEYVERIERETDVAPTLQDEAPPTQNETDDEPKTDFARKVSEARALRLVPTGDHAEGDGSSSTAVPAAPAPSNDKTAGQPAADVPSAPAPAAPAQPAPSIVAFPSAVLESEEEIEYPSIDWRKIIPPDTFLRRFMDITSRDDLPEEFYFWLGMTALGFAVGRSTVLTDSPPVTANLYVCLFGRSGLGKSRSTKVLTELLGEALPYDHDDPNSTGTYMIPSPGSAEALIDSFSREVPDPSDPKKIAYYAPVRGLIRFDELSTLTGRGSRAGSTMKPTLMEFYDAYNRVELRSRGQGHVIAELPFASAVTTTQPRAIRSLLAQSDADSGFVNRWIFACGPAKPKVSFGRVPINIHPCVEMLKSVRGWASKIREIRMSAEALDYWDGVFHGIIEPARNTTDETLLTRTDLHLKKIMLLFALDRHEEEVSLTTAMDAFHLWDYLRSSYSLLAGEIGMGDLEAARSAIKTAIERYYGKHSRGISRRELIANLNHARIPLEQISRAIMLMTSIGEIKEESVKRTSGPAAFRYSLAED
jgi:hypothetical protein